MSCWRTISFLALAALSVSIMAAFRKQPARPTAPPPVYPPCPDAAAAQWLDQAIAALEPSRTAWLRTTLREQVNAAPLAFRVEGTYLHGPDHRLRLDLQVCMERGRRRFELGSHGSTFWQLEGDAAGAWSGFTLDWRKQSKTDSAREGAQALRTEVEHHYWFSGPQRLLQNLRGQTTFTRCERLRWRERDVLLLTGVRTGAKGDHWETFRPRQCRLVLDAATLWPARVEWWGPGQTNQGDVLLMELDLTQPVVNQPVPDEVFAVPARDARIEDRTKLWLDWLSSSGNDANRLRTDASPAATGVRVAR
ncbi:MAG: hypothetical protein JNM56_04005 [Planctomycetia bacterium]|nr:hypothetical protein [Planctomycetia bacterium]